LAEALSKKQSINESVPGIATKGYESFIGNFLLMRIISNYKLNEGNAPTPFLAFPLGSIYHRLLGFYNSVSR
jgi:hypothetical protein